MRKYHEYRKAFDYSLKCLKAYQDDNNVVREIYHLILFCITARDEMRNHPDELNEFIESLTRIYKQR